MVRLNKFTKLKGDTILFDDNNYDNFGFSESENGDDFEERLTEWLNDFAKKDYAAIPDVKRCSDMISKIAEIKENVDSYLSDYDVAAEYIFPFSKRKSVLTMVDVDFCVRIPKDVGIDFSIDTIRGFCKNLNGNDYISIEPCVDGRIDLIFGFKKVVNIVLM